MAVYRREMAYNMKLVTSIKVCLAVSANDVILYKNNTKSSAGMQTNEEILYLPMQNWLSRCH